MQGNNADNNPAVDPPSSIFGINVTSLEVGKEYEISRQQAERARDTGKGAITSWIGAGTVPSLVLMTGEPGGTKGEWENKSVWFLATAPTMRLNAGRTLAAWRPQSLARSTAREKQRGVRQALRREGGGTAVLSRTTNEVANT
jgi:hypothetical protein